MSESNPRPPGKPGRLNIDADRAPVDWTGQHSDPDSRLSDDWKWSAKERTPKKHRSS